MLSLQFSIYSIYNGEILFGSRVSLIVPATLANVVGAFAYVFCPILDQWPGSVGNPRVFRSHRVGLFGRDIRKRQLFKLALVEFWAIRYESRRNDFVVVFTVDVKHEWQQLWFEGVVSHHVHQKECGLVRRPVSARRVKQRAEYFGASA